MFIQVIIIISRRNDCDLFYLCCSICVIVIVIEIAIAIAILRIQIQSDCDL